MSRSAPPHPPTDDEPQDDDHPAPRLGIAEVLADPDVTDPRDERVCEGVREHKGWRAKECFRRALAGARDEGRSGDARLDWMLRRADR